MAEKWGLRGCSSKMFTYHLRWERQVSGAGGALTHFQFGMW